MKSITILLIASLSICGNAYSQNAKIIKLDELLALINRNTENIHVINFWATWCAPCVKELPLFERLSADTLSGIKVSLISMDMDLDPNPDKVYKFIVRKKLISEVLILDEQDANSWIDKVEKKWSGALPATIIINQKTGQRKFIEKELHEGDLEKLIAEISTK
jgi:thiol-disulfide isomerase/thioredoxin